jgi:hypothetical protein
MSIPQGSLGLSYMNTWCASMAIAWDEAAYRGQSEILTACRGLKRAEKGSYGELS